MRPSLQISLASWKSAAKAKGRTSALRKRYVQLMFTLRILGMEFFVTNNEKSIPLIYNFKIMPEIFNLERD